MVNIVCNNELLNSNIIILLIYETHLTINKSLLI